MTTRLKLAVWKFASCDGCQLQILDCEDELLVLAEVVDIAYFKEATRHEDPGPYDLSLVEGSITTAHDAERIRQVRAQSRILVTIGACATSGGIQALKNFDDVAVYKSIVYATPAYVSSLATSTPIADHVTVDYAIPGCPIDKTMLLRFLSALLAGRKPDIPTHTACVACKHSGVACLMVRGIPCMGPVTRAGCDALCPKFARGCFGCFGPSETANVDALIAQWREMGVDEATIMRAFHTFQAWAPPFRQVGDVVKSQTSPSRGASQGQGRQGHD